ncbi:amino acid adenylation domain-containing protein [Kitasatospora sp. NPDC006697]|uniref:amino acid adenylation domain-containing protein n=1 Tax=Kitasatospora sp. NPDC006697 TaxID=3364020 RepID=UPI0036B2C2D9
MSDTLPEPPEQDLSAIAVTGLACRFPGADSAAEFWRLLRAGESPLETVPEQELRDAGLLESLIQDPNYVARRMRFADPALFDPGYFGLTPAEARITDPQQRFLLETAVHALEHAALDPARFRGRVGVALGLNHSDYLLQNVLPHQEAVDRLGWHRTLMGNDRGFTATQLSYRLGLTGPSIAVDCACSSSLAAIHQACRMLLDYEADAMITGGSCVKPRDLGYLYGEGGIASPDGRCRPFSADAAGTVFASGAGLVVLRRLEDALADGDRVLAVVKAGSANNDGAAKSGYTAPAQRGQAELIETVHALAGVTADSIGYVEAHGTGTALGDPIEVHALTEAFRATTDAVGSCALGSVKGNIGHLDSASGVAGLIKVVLSLHHRELPPTLGSAEPNPHLDLATSPFFLNRELRAWHSDHPLRAGVSSFGVGGTNVHLLLEEAPGGTSPGGADHGSDAVLITFGAKSADSLDTLETRLREHLDRATDANDARDTAFTLRRGQPDHPLRRGLLWRPGGEPLRVGPAEAAAPHPRNVAFLLDLPTPAPALFRELCERLPDFRRTADDLLDGLPDLDVLPQDVVRTVTTVAASAVWRAHGLVPAAVIAAAADRVAAAVLAGALSVDQLRSWLALRVGRHAELPAPGPAALTWYDADGSEHVTAGHLPTPEQVWGEAPAAPGLRTLPPLGLAVTRLTTVPAAQPLSTAALGRLARHCTLLPDAPAGIRPGAEALLAGIAGAWLGGVEGVRLPAVDALPGRVVDVPPYPFRRERHWLSAPAPGTPAPPPPGRAPQQSAEADPGAPVQELRSWARELFQETIGVPAVTDQDDLLALGGDSLLAQHLVAAAKARWGRSVPFGSFLREPTPGRLAELLGSAAQAPAPEPARVSGHGADVLPLTPSLEKFVFLDELDHAAEAYNVPVLSELRGPLDTAALRAALGDVVDRHEALRSTVELLDGQAVQRIRPAGGEVALPVLVLADETELRREIRVLLSSTIPLDSAPLLIARIFRLAPERHVLAMAVHHICADARSTGILLADLYACYARRRDGLQPELPPLDGLLAEHAWARQRAQESGALQPQLDFWLRELAGAPKVLELPADRPRGSVRSYAGRNLDFAFAPELARRIRELAASEHVTPFTVVTAAFALFLGRISDSRDVMVGTPVSGRHRPETRELVGNFVNTLPLRTTWNADQNFRDLLRLVQDRFSSALDHQDLPLEVLARHLGTDRDLSVSPVFQVLVNMLSEEASAPPAPPELRASTVPFEREASTYELSLSWWLGRDGTLSGRFMYDSARFDRETVLAWQRSFEYLLEQATSGPRTLLADLPVEPPQAAARTRAALLGPVTEVPAKPVHAVFAELAARHPERLAVADKHQRLGYGELARRSAGIAGLLTARGVRVGETVGIAMERGVPLVTALLGVLRAGATPVPFDLRHPPRRLAVIAEDSGARFVLCARAADAAFASAAEAVELADPGGPHGPDGPVPGDEVDLSVGAYVTYTSGTTGRPKGIHFPHRALANLAHYDTVVTPGGMRWLQFASFGFDVSFHETFGALCSGGSLHIVDDDDKHDHQLLPEFIREHGVQKGIFPVSLMHALAARYAAAPEPFASMREITTTGEQLRLSEQLVRFFEALPDCRLINNYGPAETHCVAFYRFTGPPRSWPPYAPIGRPIQNVTYEIRDRAGRAMPYGSVGELFISGPSVSTGYLGQPALTAERFTTDPATGARSYRSGDRVRLLPSGDLLYLGRGDQQVKIRGVRIEPAEIEVVIRRVAGVRDVYLRVSGESGDKRLDAYLIAAGDGAELPERVRGALREELPPAAVPSSFTVVTAFPVNVNGKVDPARLPAPASGARHAAVRPAEPADDVLTTVLEVFRTALEQPDLTPDQDFFDAGGHSLVATRALHGVREALGIRVSIREFYAAGTAARLAALAADRVGRTEDLAELPGPGLPEQLPNGLLRRVRTPDAAHQKTFVFRAGERLEPARLESALGVAVARHPALRLCYPAGGTPVLTAPGAARPTVEQLRLPVTESVSTAADWLVAVGQRDLIDPRQEVLLRARALRLPAGWLVSLTVHAAALDGIGLLNLVDTLAEAYRRPDAVQPEDPGYLRYLIWRQALPGTAQFERARESWRSLLPVTVPAPPVTEPERAPAPVSRVSWHPDASLLQAIRSWCTARRTTPFLLHLTAFGLALSRQGDERGTCPSVALDGRVHSALGGSVGAFANVVPVPLRLGPELTPDQAFAAVRDTFARIEAERTVPFADLAAADPALLPYLSPAVSFSYVREDGREALLAGEPFEAVNTDTLTSSQQLQFIPVEAPDSLRIELLYREGRDPEEGERLMRRYREALFTLLFDAGALPHAGEPAGAAR